MILIPAQEPQKAILLFFYGAFGVNAFDLTAAPYYGRMPTRNMFFEHMAA
jgi:hypothetical protein